MVLPNKNNTAIVFKYKNNDGYNYLTITQNNFATYKNGLLNSNFKQEVLNLINGLNKQFKTLKKVAKFFTDVDINMDTFNLMVYINGKIAYLNDILNKLEK